MIQRGLSSVAARVVLSTLPLLVAARAASGSTFTLPPGHVALNVATGPDGNFYFEEVLIDTQGDPVQSAIGVMSANGTLIGEFQFPTPFEGAFFGTPTPWGLTIGPDLKMWFVEPANGRIGNITSDGTITDFTLGASCRIPADLVADPVNNGLWVSCADTNSLAFSTIGGVISTHSFAQVFGTPPPDFSTATMQDIAMAAANSQGQRVVVSFSGGFAAIVEPNPQGPTGTIEKVPESNRIAAAPALGGIVSSTLQGDLLLLKLPDLAPTMLVNEAFATNVAVDGSLVAWSQQAKAISADLAGVVSSTPANPGLGLTLASQGSLVAFTSPQPSFPPDSPSSSITIQPVPSSPVRGNPDTRSYSGVPYRLDTHDGKTVYWNELVDALDQGNIPKNENGQITSDLVVIAENCFGGTLLQNLADATVASNAGIPAFTHLNGCSSNGVGQLSLSHGAVQGVIQTLSPANTLRFIARAMTTAAKQGTFDGVTVNEQPLCIGDRNDRIGGHHSTHVIFFAGNVSGDPHDAGSAADLEQIQALIHNFPVTATQTLTILEGNGSAKFNPNPDGPGFVLGPATRGRLLNALKSVAQTIADEEAQGFDEQLVLVLGDHGGQGYGVRLPRGSKSSAPSLSTSVSLGAVDAAAITHLGASPRLTVYAANLGVAGGPTLAQVSVTLNGKNLGSLATATALPMLFPDGAAGTGYQIAVPAADVNTAHAAKGLYAQQITIANQSSTALSDLLVILTAGSVATVP